MPLSSCCRLGDSGSSKLAWDLKQMLALTEMLGASMWAHNLATEHLRRVTAEITRRDVPAGAFVCRKGEPVEHWIGVIDGLLKISVVSPAGRSMTLTGVAAGGWFGEGSMLKTEARRYDAIALRATRVACVSRATFNWLCEVSIPFNRFLVNQINERCGQFIAMLEAD